ncbi:MAG: Smr/MutS family protein, partial [Nitrospiraceae bacterium]|nr:Smr/MutS family protein [Nitrospiraceae bacterium]
DIYVQVPVSEAILVASIPEKTSGGVTLESASDEAAAGSINLVGLRVEEALSRLEPFLNHASITGLNEVTIIHGVGTGRLMKAVRQYLKGHPLIENFRRADPSAAATGEGVTIASIR